jgi:methionine aminotransferase
MHSPVNIQSKMPQIGESIFSIMSKMGAEHDAINLSQGFPDFPVDPELVKLVTKYMKAGKNQYAPMPGVPELRKAIAKKINRTYGREYNPDTEITVTSGATQGIFAAISALIKEEDEVIVFTPAYDCYVPPILLNHGKPVYVQMQAPEYRVNWDEVRKLVTRRTKMFVINTPHNPTGTTWSDQDMRELEKLAVDCDALVLSDEVYEHIVFDGEKHNSASRYEELAKRSLITCSFGKTFHATGWKVGYIYGPENLMAEVRKVHQYLVFSVSTPMQYALAEFISEPENYEQLPGLYQAKRDLFFNAMEGSKFTGEPAEGTYFQLLNYSELGSKKETEMAEFLTKNHGVASIPVSVFYHQPLEQTVLRFCFAKSDETLLKAAELLKAL